MLIYAIIVLKIHVVNPFRVLVKFAFRTKNLFQPPSIGFGHLSSEARVTSMEDFFFFGWLPLFFFGRLPLFFFGRLPLFFLGQNGLIRNCVHNFF